MASISQINAKHSTGPKSKAGKHTVSQNSRRHGFTAHVMPGSDEHAQIIRRTDHLMKMFGLHPVSRPAAMALAAAQVRLERIRTTRASELAATISSSSPASDRLRNHTLEAQGSAHLLAKLDRYERAAQAQRDQALQELLMLAPLKISNSTMDRPMDDRSLNGRPSSE